MGNHLIVTVSGPYGLELLYTVTRSPSGVVWGVRLLQATRIPFRAWLWVLWNHREGSGISDAIREAINDSPLPVRSLCGRSVNVREGNTKPIKTP